MNLFIELIKIMLDYIDNQFYRIGVSVRSDFGSIKPHF